MTRQRKKKKKIKGLFKGVLLGAVLISLVTLSTWVFFHPMQARAKKENRKPQSPVPVVKSIPSQDPTFYKSLKERKDGSGGKGNIVGLVPPEVSSRPESSADSRPEGPLSSRFTLQVASLKDYKKAVALKDHLAGQGFPSYILSAEIPEKGVYYRIRVGHYTTRKGAEDALARLKEKGEKDAIMARETVVSPKTD